jgi:hypothetical protein
MLRPTGDVEANRLDARRLGDDADDIGDEPAQSSQARLVFRMPERLARQTRDYKHLDGRHADER